MTLEKSVSGSLESICTMTTFSVFGISATGRSTPPDASSTVVQVEDGLAVNVACRARAHKVAHGNPSIDHCKSGCIDCRALCSAIGLEDLDEDVDLRARGVLAQDDCLEGLFDEERDLLRLPVPLRPALALASAEGGHRELAVDHRAVMLRRAPPHYLPRPVHRCDHLCVALLEEGTSVCIRADADLAGDPPQLMRAPAVHAQAFIGDQLVPPRHCSQ
eukprot:CAMPEP_0114609082 /NCGR_PEP_ID=MMETSP0168-20121206/2907_1 /TAXON_ID=95228 ORGANISM="Vannella sp., Strain DIVA3 517/6/12" /NCGR_SAMPLE_ID=MMETSP0168 /ASSEMBLY_ACC=CAM_ASM_000044 /LENGTH=217 /DNA_ID=CAMNT_0001819993 /DNA_START=64 /DNA_END=713 /DNA_ORIENTATION=+